MLTSIANHLAVGVKYVDVYYQSSFCKGDVYRPRMHMLTSIVNHRAVGVKYSDVYSQSPCCRG